MFPKKVKIVEVGPRDGLQNEKVILPLATKVELINRLSETGLSVIECGSFVSPKWIPQMASSGDVFSQISRNKKTKYTALVPNMQGYEAAKEAKVNEIAIFASATESFSKRNINCSIAESFARFEPVVNQAHKDNIPVRGYISCVMGCPYEGVVSTSQVLYVAKHLNEIGCYEISLGDTIGVGTPLHVKELISELIKKIPEEKLAVHFHDTYGQAIVNIYAALEIGISIIDSSVSGLGGCPYAHGASGNVATEDVLYLLEGLGIETGVDIDKIISVSHFIANFLGKEPNSKVAQALG
jgi:hydroxymethylglutaryl-CoA lyase